MKYMAAVLLLVATIWAQNAPSTSKADRVRFPGDDQAPSTLPADFFSQTPQKQHIQWCEALYADDAAKHYAKVKNVPDDVILSEAPIAEGVSCENVPNPHHAEYCAYLARLRQTRAAGKGLEQMIADSCAVRASKVGSPHPAVAATSRRATEIKGPPDGCYEGDPKEIEGLPKGAIVCPLGTAARDAEGRGALKSQHLGLLDIPAISREANGAIVSIVMSDKDSHPIAKGSGFFISKDGRILTNYHVIKSGTSAVVKLPDGASFDVDGVLAVDKDRDVAVIKAHGNDFRTLTLGDSDRLQVGEEVVAIGNPLSLESTVSNGIVSAVRTIQTEGGKFLQITAPISPGSSGGPLFNMAGEVVGITTSHLEGGENLNFAIPINDVRPLLLARSTKARALPDEGEPTAAEAATSPSPKNFYSSWSGVIVVDRIYTFTKAYKAKVHMVLSDQTIFRFEIACLAKYPDCAQLTVGGKFKIEKMLKGDPDLYPNMEYDYNLGSVRVTGSEQSTVYFVVNQESAAARSDNAEAAERDEAEPRNQDAQYQTCLTQGGTAFHVNPLNGLGGGDGCKAADGSYHWRATPTPTSEDRKLRARDHLNKGVTAYRNAKYAEAIDYFQQSVALDPTLINAKMYLATAFVSQYIPGVDSPDNLRTAQQAIDEYSEVLDAPAADRDQKVNSAKGVAYLYLNQKKWDDAKKYYRMASDMDPNDPEPYYSVAVIDWTACYQPRIEERAKLGLRPEESLNPKNKDQKRVCDELKVKNTPAIREGIDSLNKAIQLRPDYDDAMVYMNLMYREKADVECDDLNARQEDLRAADNWVDQTLLTKKAKAEKQPRP
jgi:S1-C subfamily serine protease/tetratricopeptide (TPR) repeat protein